MSANTDTKTKLTKSKSFSGFFGFIKSKSSKSTKKQVSSLHHHSRESDHAINSTEVQHESSLYEKKHDDTQPPNAVTVEKRDNNTHHTKEIITKQWEFTELEDCKHKLHFDSEEKSEPESDDNETLKPQSKNKISLQTQKPSQLHHIQSSDTRKLHEQDSIKDLISTTNQTTISLSESSFEKNIKKLEERPTRTNNIEIGEEDAMQTKNRKEVDDEQHCDNSELPTINLINNRSKTIVLQSSFIVSPTFPRREKKSLKENRQMTVDIPSTHSKHSQSDVKNRLEKQRKLSEPQRKDSISLIVQNLEKTNPIILKKFEGRNYTPSSNRKILEIKVDKTTINKKNFSVFQTTGMNESFRSRKNVTKNKMKEHKNGEYTLEQFDITVTLGTGTFGRVFLVEEKGRKDTVFAMKIMKIQEIIKLNQVEHVNSERSILKLTDHPLIMKCYWTHRDEKCLYMLFEYVPGGELFTYLRNKGRFPPEDTLFYICEIISVLGYLHENDIVYRDLKPENLLLDKEGHLKFTDFGFAKCLNDITWTLCGTPEYLSPEAIQGKGHDWSCDWWALGILTYEMLVGDTPFVDISPFGLYQKILGGVIHWPAYLYGSIQQDFIGRLVVVDRSERLGQGQNGTADVKNHKWFAHVNWDDVKNKKIKPPIVPRVAFSGDTSNFEDFDENFDLRHIACASVNEQKNFEAWEK